MCSSMNERIRINQILNEAVQTCADDRARTQDELAQFLYAALQMHYHGLCVDECLEAKARGFAIRHLKRLTRADASSKPRLPDAA
jgi:hypothetical protein